MHIRHERPMSDLSFQVRAPLGLELATGDVVTLQHWSLSGFDFPGDSDLLPKEAVLSIPFQGVDIRFPVKLEATGRGRQMTFKGLTGRQRETLAVFYRSILSGKMAPTEDIITSLDTPVDLVPMEETAEEESAARTGKSSRGVRAAGAILLYTLIAVLVFWTLGGGIYAAVATIDIENARAEAALTDHPALQNAYVSEVLVAPGDLVAAGDVLVTMSNPDDDAALEEVRSRITLLEDRIVDAQARASDLSDRIIEARAAIAARQAVATPLDRDGLLQDLDAFDHRFAAAHLDLFSAHDAAVALVDTLEEDLRRLKRERGQLKETAEAGHIIATHPGVVAEVLVFEQQFVIRGTRAVTLEASTARTARGWMEPDLASALFVGMPVSASFMTAGGRQTLEGEVLALEAGIDQTLSPEFGMIVTVGFPDLSVDDSRQILLHQMPIDLDARRAWAERFDTHLGTLRAVWGDQ